MQFALSAQAAALLVLPLVLVTQAWAKDNAEADYNPNASLPLPQLKAASSPQPTGQLQPAGLQQPVAQTQPGALPQASGQPASRMPQPKTSRRAQLAEPLPPVDPQRKAVSPPQPTGQLQPAGLQRPVAQTQPGVLPQASGQPASRMSQLKTSRRAQLAEPLPPVDPPSLPIPLQPLAQGVSRVLETFAGTSNAGYTQPPARPAQIPIPMPLVRPQQVTVPGGLRPLSDITTDIAPPGGPLPKDRSDVLSAGMTNPMFYARSASLVRYQWEAPVVCHRPLYFQDVPLEHFGQSCCPYLQPAISAAKFLGNVLILPYRVALDPPCSETYNLRTYPRPGTPVPCLRETLPLRLKPLLVEMGIVTAIVLVIP